MEELHRLHKDVPFGWVAWIQDALARRACKATVRGRPVLAARVGQHPGDLHHLAGPH